MKHKAVSSLLAALLAALLAGCGAKTAASARPAGSRELKSTPPDSMHATAAITEQYTLGCAPARFPPAHSVPAGCSVTGLLLQCGHTVALRCQIPVDGQQCSCKSAPYH